MPSNQNRVYPIDVSVIIPARNAQSFIEQAIESVTQEDAVGEIIVVDHASTDSTAQYVTELQKDSPHGTKIHLLSAPDGGGPSRAKNTGLAASRGEFVTFLDADDIRLGESILHQMEILRKDQDVGAAFGRIAGLMDSANTPIMDKSFYAWLSASNAMNRQRGGITADRIAANELPGYFTLLYRRSLLDTAGPFDETLPQAEDFDMAYRCAKISPIAFFDGPCVFYRIHDKNLSITKDAADRAVTRPETKISHRRALAKHGL